MLTTAQEVFSAVKSLHAEVYGHLLALKSGTQTSNDKEELADLVLAMKHSLKYLKDLQKEVNQCANMAERIACLLWLKEGTGEPIRTEYTTATPTIKEVAAIPTRRKNPEAFAALMRGLNVPADLWIDSDVDEVVRVHWPGFVEYMTRRAGAGLPLPAGIDPHKVYPLYSLTVRKTKEIDACTSDSSDGP